MNGLLGGSRSPKKRTSGLQSTIKYIPVTVSEHAQADRSGSVGGSEDDVRSTNEHDGRQMLINLDQQKKIKFIPSNLKSNLYLQIIKKIGFQHLTTKLNNKNHPTMETEQV